MNEAGNVTWDLVDVLATDGIRLCDEGLVADVPFDEWLAPAPDGTPASEDLGKYVVSDCHIPTNLYSTTFGYRTDVAAWNGKVPEDICAIFDLETFPGKRALEKRPINNLEWALVCSGVPVEEVYDTLETQEGVDKALAKLATIKDQTVWWSAGAETPQLLADGEVVIGSTYNGRLFSVIEEQKQPVAMLWDYQVFDIDGFVVPVGPPRGPTEPGEALPALRHGHPAPRRPGEVHLLRPGTRLLAAARHHPCRPRHRDGAAHADGAGQRQDGLSLQLRMVGGPPRRDRRALPVLARAVGQ